MTTDPITPITDYWATLKPLLLSQYAQATRLQGLLAAPCAQGDQFEVALSDLRSGWLISNATGNQLDALGALWNESRLGRTDAVYRVAVATKAAVAVNGCPDEVVSFLKAMYPTEMAGAVYSPEYPAGFAICTDDTSIPTSVVQSLAAAGVGAAFAVPIIDALGNPMTTATGDALFVARE